MLITPEIQKVIDKAVDVYGDVARLAKRLGVTEGTVGNWRSGRTREINGAFWVNRALPALLGCMTEEERRSIIPPHVLAHVLAKLKAQPGMRVTALSAATRPAVTRNKPPQAISREGQAHPAAKPAFNPKANPPGKQRLTEELVLSWADAYHARTGKWPRAKPVAVEGTTWLGIDTALSKGYRGFPGGASLAKLLKKSRGATNHPPQTKLPVEQILAWADEYHARTGEWPTFKSGPAGNMTWHGVNAALSKGRRGFPGGSSLGLFLAVHGRRPLRFRGHRQRSPLTQGQILAWGKEHFERTGRWPSMNSKAVRGHAGEVWRNIDTALRFGRRGLPKGGSLAKLLNPEGCKTDRPGFTEELILAWAAEHRRITGRWPSVASGPVHGVPGERWVKVNTALSKGYRGLPGGSSLAKLLAPLRASSLPEE